jgi:hypothetical protein
MDLWDIFPAACGGTGSKACPGVHTGDSPPVYFPSMPCLDNANDEFIISNLIQDAIVSNTYPVDIILAFNLFSTCRTGIFLQIVYNRLYPLLDIPRQFTERPRSMIIENDNIGHL